MSDLKIVPEAGEPGGHAEPGRSNLPVPASDAGFTRRDLDLIKRDLITVRKDYHEIRNNMVVLTHQHSSAPSRTFFVVSGAVWLVIFAALMTFQSQLAVLGDRLAAQLPVG